MKKASIIALAFAGFCLAGTAARAQEPTKDIVDTAVGAGSFKTLAKALEVAGLVDVLKGKGPFTVFAPTDEAFAKLPKATLEAVLADKEKLTAILTYHVVAGKVLAKDVVKLDSAKSVQGSPIAIKVDGGKVMVNQANVVKTDILTTNGVIHVIDAVILPPAKTSAVPATPSPTAAAPVHPATVQVVSEPCHCQGQPVVVRQGRMFRIIR
ncbi:MAG: fasciclin domain-containing protein [Gemmataceae bacterium]|nr:fasciclin domain-containing protein [Gemmataceae bacterium]